MHYLICILAALGVHRLWNGEDIFAPFRYRLARIKPLVCSACNAFWISAATAVVAGLAGFLEPMLAWSLPLAAYPVLRLAAWSYVQPWGNLFAKPASTPASTSGPSVPNLPPPDCPTCGQKAQALMAESERVRTFTERIVILTPRAVSACLPLATALSQGHPRRLIQIWCEPGALRAAQNLALPANVEIQSVLLPAEHWLGSAPPMPESAKNALVGTLSDRLIRMGNATVITDQLLFNPGMPTLDAAVRHVGRLPAFRWLHDLGDGTAALRSDAPFPEHHTMCVASVEAHAALAQRSGVRAVHYGPGGLAPEGLIAATMVVPMPTSTALLSTPVART